MKESTKTIAHLNKEGKLIFTEVTSHFVYQANYLAKRKDGHIVDDVIAGYTKIFPCNWGTPPVSHTCKGVEVDGEAWFCSSTSRNELGSGKKNGTRWIKASKLLRNPNRWIIQEKIYPTYEIIDMIRRANSLIWQPYDFIGVGVDFIFPIDLIRKKKSIYCSKFVHFIDTGKYRRYSPRHKYKWAVKNGWRISSRKFN